MLLCVKSQLYHSRAKDGIVVLLMLYSCSFCGTWTRFCKSGEDDSCLLLKDRLKGLLTTGEV